MRPVKYDVSEHGDIRFTINSSSNIPSIKGSILKIFDPDAHFRTLRIIDIGDLYFKWGLRQNEAQPKCFAVYYKITF